MNLISGSAVNSLGGWLGYGLAESESEGQGRNLAALPNGFSAIRHSADAGILESKDLTSCTYDNVKEEELMIMIRSVVRPEKVDAVLAALMEAGFPAVTKMSVVGRGKQRGIKIGEITYDEIPKELLLTVVKDADKDFVIKTVLKAARTGDQGRLRRRQDLCLPGGRSLHHQLRHQGERRRGTGRGQAMKEIMAIVRINMMNKTKKALAEAGISSITARDALGRGKGLVDLTLLEGAEKGYEEAIAQLGQSQRLIPKRIFFVVVPDRLVKKTVQTIMAVNRTGKSGDGKIFVMPVMDSVRVRTGESGDQVLDEA